MRIEIAAAEIGALDVNLKMQPTREDQRVLKFNSRLSFSMPAIKIMAVTFWIVTMKPGHKLPIQQDVKGKTEFATSPPNFTPLIFSYPAVNLPNGHNSINRGSLPLH
ncbi:unnamed protein product [Linum trigynum]|uniref:Uncharacterized protein n=1 Tax=Linum trigynum TaxID=586398 RepID=A0AAV2E0C3_9ROSI